MKKLLTKKAVARDGWADALLAAFAEEGFQGPDNARQACETILRDPVAVAHPRWAELVEAAIDATPDFEDVAEELYGERVAFDDDEGWLCQGWDDYTTAAEVARLLGTPEARAHPRWADLAAKLIEASTVPGTAVEVDREMLIPAIEAGDDRWPALMPAYTQARPYEFVGSLLRHHAVLDHPDVLSWYEPFAGYRSGLQALLDKNVIEHPTWLELAKLASRHQSMTSDRDFAKVAALMDDR